MKQARIAIDRHVPLAETDPRLFGSFLEHLGRAVYGGIYQPGQATADENGFREDTAALVRALGVPVVRYPGGNFVSGYRWEDGVGPKESRPRRLEYAWHVTETNQFGLGEFVSWCRKVNTAPMMAVNLGTRGMEEAKDLLEYCNHPGGSAMSDLRVRHGYAAPHNIRLWCLGNEMDGPWQMGHKTATEYGRLANETGRIMKTYDPSLELVVCGSSGPGMATFGEWEREVLTQSWDIADYVSMHMYWNNRAGDTPSFLAESVRMDRFIADVVSVCDYVRAVKRSKKKVNLSFDEWNVWYHSAEQDRHITPWCEAPHQLEDVYNFEDALLVGSALITLLRHADRVKIACLAQLVNVIAPIMTSDTGAWRQTTYYPFADVSALGRGTVMQTTVLSPTYACRTSDCAPYLDAAAVADEEAETLTFFAVNKSLDEPMEIACDLRQYADYRVTAQSVLTHDDLKAVNMEDAPDTVAPRAAAGAVNDAGRFTAVLGPHSWNVIQLKKA